MTCPVCASDQIRTVGRDWQRPDNAFLSCRVCRHGFMSKASFEAGTAEQIEYNQDVFFGKEDEGALEWFPDKPAYEPYAALHGKYLQTFANGKQLLEIGCGWGGFIGYLQQHTDFVCHGNDISSKACAGVREKYHVPVYQGPFTQDLVGGKRFDAVFLNHVIEHIPDVRAFAKSIRDVTQPGGVVGVVCPNDQSLTAAFKRRVVFPLKKTHEYGHIHWPMHPHGFSMQSLTRLFAANHFEPLLQTTLCKLQREYDCRPTLIDRAFTPLYLAELLLNKGSLLMCYFRAV